MPAIESLLESLAVPFETSATWKSRSEALRKLDRLAPAPMPPELAKRLREYQRVGVAWFWHLWQNQLGGVLADEMGLGKTAQALAMLALPRTNRKLEQVEREAVAGRGPGGIAGQLAAGSGDVDANAAGLYPSQ